MWKTWGTSSSWKGGGTFHQPHLFGNHLRYQPDGNLFTRWEAPAFSQWNTQLATKEECHKEGDSFCGWHSAACQQSGEMWPYLCRTDVTGGCQSKGTVILYPSDKRIQVRSVLVTFLFTSWNGFSLLCSSNFGQADYCIQTDSCGSWGHGAVFDNYWFQWLWPVEWNSLGIMAKELAPIVIGHVVWGPTLRNNMCYSNVTTIAWWPVFSRGVLKRSFSNTSP